MLTDIPRGGAEGGEGCESGHIAEECIRLRYECCTEEREGKVAHTYTKAKVTNLRTSETKKLPLLLLSLSQKLGVAQDG
ncbi:hypothetical protein NTE_03524 [Candidatus Nitrososphaera evergladensis SR1]|uniref:Uncharacterized protein n=1 Tax=Candidatus Nitrososphaera evergladensis SR1 TaxID=1459636 RepID=A0A075MY20_9ARCH|nr:hypothetical protein NTE_03524 [Candidatus Nitrososphaera evergladensis SR1]